VNLKRFSLKDKTNRVAEIGTKLSERPHEGALTRVVEMQTGKLPSIAYLNAAVASMLVSAGFAVFSRRKEFATFIGLWAPSILLIGVYNKLVKIEQGDRSALFRRRAA